MLCSNSFQNFELISSNIDKILNMSGSLEFDSIKYEYELYKYIEYIYKNVFVICKK